VGAVRALFERGIFPDMVIGCSAGSLNAVQIARSPTLESVDTLTSSWLQCTISDVYPGSRIRAAMRFVRGKDSLFDNRALYALLQRHGVTPAHTFANWATIPLYITATDLRTGHMHVFGDNPNDRVLDAMMASTALTPLHPPWEVHGERFVDGGAVTPLPLRTALDRGADEIWALHIWDSNRDHTDPVRVRGVLNVLSRNLDAMLRMQAQHDLLLARTAPNVRLHYLKLEVSQPIHVLDFSRSQELIDHGYAIARDFLDATLPTPNAADLERPPLTRRLANSLAGWFSPRSAFSPAEGRTQT
jgi:NTE family protein